MDVDPAGADITNRLNALREIVTAQMNALNEQVTQRMNGQDNARRQYLESLSARSDFFQAEIDQRLGGIQLQIDQRFGGAETAMRTALESSNKAVTAALDAAEKAVAKAEVAAEKRFEAVNEFRAQLSDQATTFISRVEAEARLTSIADKSDALTSRNAELIAALELHVTSRLDRMTGEHSGALGRRTEARLDTGTILQTLSVIAAFAAVVIILIVSK